MSWKRSERQPLLSSKSVSQESRQCRFFAVEPVVVLYFIAFHATGPLMQQLVYARIGDALKNRQNESSSTVTKNVSSACTEDFDQQQQQQTDASQMQMIFTVAAVVPALFSTLLLGAYSDYAGRKWAIAAPLVGEMFRIITCIIVATTSVPIMLLALGLFLEGVSGSAAGFMMGAYSYMADTADPKHRTLRLVIVEFCMGVGNTGAQVAVGYVIAEFGWLGPLVGVLIMHVVSFIYVLCCLPETITYNPPSGKSKHKFISFKHYLRTARLYVTDQPHKRRLVLQLCLLIIALTIMIDITGTEILTLYLLNWPFCWNSIDIGYYNAVAYAARYIGAIVLVWTLRKCLPESVLMVIGILSNIAFDIVLAIAMVDWVVYLGKHYLCYELVIDLGLPFCALNKSIKKFEFKESLYAYNFN